MAQSTMRGRAVDQQLSLYSEQAEQWKSQHLRAMDCLDLEAILSFGLHLYRVILDLNERWAQDAESRKMPRDLEAVQRFHAWYTAWLKPCRAILLDIEQLEADGFKVSGAEAFRAACIDVRATLSIPWDRERESGPGKTTQDVRDGLRRRLGIGG